MYICIGIRKTLETLTTRGSSDTKLLLTFRFSTRGERDTIFTMLTVPSDPTTRGESRRPNWPGLAEAQKSTRFAQVRISTAFFSKITQNPQPISSRHDIIHIPSPISIWGFYYDICDCHILPMRE